VPGDVQEDRGHRQAGADRGADGDQAHVFHGGVGEHAFVVALRDQQQRGERERGQAHGQ